MKTIFLMVLSFAVLDIVAWSFGWNRIMLTMFELHNSTDLFTYLLRYPLAIGVYFTLNAIYNYFSCGTEVVEDASS